MPRAPVSSPRSAQNCAGAADAPSLLCSGWIASAARSSAWQVVGRDIMFITAVITRCPSPCQQHSYDGTRASLRRRGCVPRRHHHCCCCMLHLASDCLPPCRCVRHRAQEAGAHGAGAAACDELETSIYASSLLLLIFLSSPPPPSRILEVIVTLLPPRTPCAR